MENTSGQGARAQVPPEIDRWNWGAFLLNWIWGLGNNTYRALLICIPFVGFVMWIMLGVKGSAWAWRHKRWDSVEHFQAVQRKWTRWAFGVLAVSVLAFAGVFFGVMSMMKNSNAYQLSLATVQRSEEAARIMGTPIESGTPTGSFNSTGTDGQAHLTYSVSGPSGSGRVYVEATQRMGQWRIDNLVLQDDKTGRRFTIVGAML